MIQRADALSKFKADPRVRQVVARMETMPGLSRLAHRMAPPDPRYRRFIRRAWPYAVTSGATFGFAYFFDKDQGRGRRAKAKDRAAGLARRSVRKTRRAGRMLSSEAAGMRQRWQHREGNGVPLDDATLVDKIRSEVFGDRAIDTSRLNVNAEKGVVFVRGIVDVSDQVDRLERRIRLVKGVVDVRMLVHLKSMSMHRQEAPMAASGDAMDAVRSQRA